MAVRTIDVGQVGMQAPIYAQARGSAVERVDSSHGCERKCPGLKPGQKPTTGGEQLFASECSIVLTARKRRDQCPAFANALLVSHALVLKGAANSRSLERRKGRPRKRRTPRYPRLAPRSVSVSGRTAAALPASNNLI